MIELRRSRQPSFLSPIHDKSADFARRMRNNGQGSGTMNHKISAWKILISILAVGAFAGGAAYLSASGFWIYHDDSSMLESTIKVAKAHGYPMSLEEAIGPINNSQEIQRLQKVLSAQMAAIKSTLAKLPKGMRLPHETAFPRSSRATAVPENVRWMIANAGPQIDAATATMLKIGRSFLITSDLETAMFRGFENVDAVKILNEYACDRAIVNAIDNNLDAAIANIKTAIALTNCLSQHPLITEGFMYFFASATTAKAISQCMEIHPERASDLANLYNSLELLDVRPSLRLDLYHVIPYFRNYRELQSSEGLEDEEHSLPVIKSGLPTDLKGRAYLTRAIRIRMQLLDLCDLSKPRNDTHLIGVFKGIDNRQAANPILTDDAMEYEVQISTYNLKRRLQIQYERAYCIAVLAKSIEFWKHTGQLPTSIQKLNMGTRVSTSYANIGFVSSKNELRIYNYGVDGKDNHGRLRAEAIQANAQPSDSDEVYVFRLAKAP